jgi:hypothetical protein
MIARPPAVLLVLALSAAVSSTASAQTDYPKSIVHTFALDSVTDALKAEAESHQLKFVSSDKHGAIFRREEGSVLMSGRQTPVVREVTFHFEKAKTGTRVVATEVLILIVPGAEDRRTPSPEDRATDLQDLLLRTRARVDGAKAATSDSAAATSDSAAAQ